MKQILIKKGIPYAAEVPAPQVEDGKIAVLDDYKSITVHGAKNISLQTRLQDKGLMIELERFAKGIQTGEWPIPWWQQLQVSEVAFAVEEMLFE